MEAKELRPSNYIGAILDEDAENYFTVIEVANTMKCYEGLSTLEDIESKRYNIGFWDLSYFEPIPLTEDWLIKFGFRKKERKMDKSHNFDLNISKHYVVRVSGGEIYLPYIGWTGKMYVHQLQNLYFALTGEELTIKE